MQTWTYTRQTSARPVDASNILFYIKRRTHSRILCVPTKRREHWRDRIFVAIVLAELRRYLRIVVGSQLDSLTSRKKLGFCFRHHHFFSFLTHFIQMEPCRDERAGNDVKILNTLTRNANADESVLHILHSVDVHAGRSSFSRPLGVSAKSMAVPRRTAGGPSRDASFVLFTRTRLARFVRYAGPGARHLFTSSLICDSAFSTNRIYLPFAFSSWAFYSFNATRSRYYSSLERKFVEGS